MDPGRFLDGLLAVVPFEQWLGLRVTLWMIALAPILTLRRLGTIASVTPEERQHVLERLLASPIYVVRQLALSFKALATLLYVQSAGVREAMTEPLNPAARGLVSATRMLRSRQRAQAEALPSREGEHDHAAE